MAIERRYNDPSPSQRLAQHAGAAADIDRRARPVAGDDQLGQNVVILVEQAGCKIGRSVEAGHVRLGGPLRAINA